MVVIEVIVAGVVIFIYSESMQCHECELHLQLSAPTWDLAKISSLYRSLVDLADTKEKKVLYIILERVCLLKPSIFSKECNPKKYISFRDIHIDVLFERYFDEHTT